MGKEAKSSAAPVDIRRMLPAIEPNISLNIADAVWHGIIKRLRIYDQSQSAGNKVFAYLAPGNNENYIGWSSDPNVIHALFLACDNGRQVTGYTNAQYKIEWMDYPGI